MRWETYRAIILNFKRLNSISCAQDGMAVSANSSLHSCSFEPKHQPYVLPVFAQDVCRRRGYAFAHSNSLFIGFLGRTRSLRPLFYRWDEARLDLALKDPTGLPPSGYSDGQS